MENYKNLAKITELLSTSDKEFDKISKYIKILYENKTNDIQERINIILKKKKSKKQTLINLCPIRGFIIKQMANQKNFKESELEILKNQFKEIYATLNVCLNDQILKILLETCVEFAKADKNKILEKTLPEDPITFFVYFYLKRLDSKYYPDKNFSDLFINVSELHNYLLKNNSPSLLIIELLIDYLIQYDSKNINKIWIGISHQNYKEKIDFNWMIQSFSKIIVCSNDEILKNILNQDLINFMITISSKKNPNNVFYDDLLSSSEFQSISENKASNILFNLIECSTNYSGLLFITYKLSSFLIKKINPESVINIYKTILNRDSINFNQLSSIYYIVKCPEYQSYEQHCEFSFACLRIYIKESDQKALEYFKNISHLYLKYITKDKLISLLSEYFTIIRTSENAKKYQNVLSRWNKIIKMIENDVIDIFLILSFAFIIFNIESIDKTIQFLKNIKFSLKNINSNESWFGVWFEEIIEISILPYKSAILIAITLIKKSKDLIDIICVDTILRVLESPKKEIFNDSTNNNIPKFKLDQCPISLVGDDIDITTLGEDAFDKLDQYLANSFNGISKLKDENLNKNNLFFIQTRMALLIDNIIEINESSTFNQFIISLKILIISSSKNIVKTNDIFKKLQNSSKKLIKKIKNNQMTVEEFDILYNYIKKSEKLLPVVSYNQIWALWIEKILNISSQCELEEKYKIIVENLLKKLILRFIKKKKENLNHTFFCHLFACNASDFNFGKLSAIVLKNLHLVNGPKFKINTFILFWNSLIKYSSSKLILKGIKKLFVNFNNQAISSKNSDLLKKTFQAIIKKHPKLKKNIQKYASVLNKSDSCEIKEILNKILQ